DPLAAAVLGLDPLDRDLDPAAGRAAEVDHARARPQEAELVVELQELEGGARAVAALAGLGDIRVVELALQPALRGDGAPARGPDAHRGAPAGRAAPLVRRHGGSILPLAERIGFAVGLAHEVHQHALAQAAVGDAHLRRLPLPAHRFENGAAGQRQVGPVAADAGPAGQVGDRQGRELVADAQDLGAGDARTVDHGAVVTLQSEVVGADGGDGARHADHLDLAAADRRTDAVAATERAQPVADAPDHVVVARPPDRLLARQALDAGFGQRDHAPRHRGHVDKLAGDAAQAVVAREDADPAHLGRAAA